VTEQDWIQGHKSCSYRNDLYCRFNEQLLWCIDKNCPLITKTKDEPYTWIFTEHGKLLSIFKKLEKAVGLLGAAVNKEIKQTCKDIEKIKKVYGQ
jgi:hypothetical protein